MKYEIMRLVFSLEKTINQKFLLIHGHKELLTHSMYQFVRGSYKRPIFIHYTTSCEDCKLKHGYAFFSTFE